jgi:Zn-dependent M28 family amino/carboxypeptidase
MGTRGQRLPALAVALLVALAACGGPAPSVPRAPVAGAVAAAITEDGLRRRLEELAAVTGASTAWRALGGNGYDAAATLVSETLRRAGWTVAEDRFTANAFADDGGSSLIAAGRTFGSSDVRPLIYAPGGTAEGPAVALDWDPHATGPGTKGCAASDYGSLPAGAVVLVRSGPCYRRDEVLAAQAAGAAGFIAVAGGAAPGTILRSTLIAPAGLRIPAAAVSVETAGAVAAIAAAGGSVRLETHARTWPVETRSILAELPGRTADAVVMLGAHLDSVIDGPGTNDDGSGVAALLEIARALGGTRPEATIRLGFWTAEEEGLLGSAHYVEGLGPHERAAIVAYLNADMIGSPNGFAGVYEEPAGASGSAALRALAVSGLERLGATPVGIEVAGSDHLPFQQAGIPTGGVFSGATERLDAAQAASFGGRPGDPADPCYHQACDGLENVNLPLARLLAAGLADLAVRIAENPVLVPR